MEPITTTILRTLSFARFDISLSELLETTLRDSQHYCRLDRHSRRAVRQTVIREFKSRFGERSTIAFVPEVGPSATGHVTVNRSAKKVKRTLFGREVYNRHTKAVQESLNVPNMEVPNLKKPARLNKRRRLRQRLLRRRGTDNAGQGTPTDCRVPSQGSRVRSNRITRRNAFRGVLRVEGIIFTLTNVASAIVGLGLDLSQFLARIGIQVRNNFLTYFAQDPYPMMFIRFVAHFGAEPNLLPIYERYITQVQTTSGALLAGIIIQWQRRFNLPPTEREVTESFARTMATYGLVGFTTELLNGQFIDFTVRAFRLEGDLFAEYIKIQVDKALLRVAGRRVVVSTLQLLTSIPILRVPGAVVGAFTDNYNRVQAFRSLESNFQRTVRNRVNDDGENFDDFIQALHSTLDEENLADVIIRGAEAFLHRLVRVTPGQDDNAERIVEIEEDSNDLDEILREGTV